MTINSNLIQLYLCILCHFLFSQPFIPFSLWLSFLLCVYLFLSSSIIWNFLFSWMYSLQMIPYRKNMNSRLQQKMKEYSWMKIWKCVCIHSFLNKNRIKPNKVLFRMTAQVKSYLLHLGGCHFRMLLKFTMNYYVGHWHHISRYFLSGSGLLSS